MPIINRIAEFHADMTAWRRDFHAHPELGYEEVRTSGLVAERLRAFGVDEVHTDLAKTGVVGVIRGKNGGAGEGIGLRADMDALPIHEESGAPHASTVPGKMHACGHDGHTTMLLGAARYLAETRNFHGTAYVIFQPAEEGGAGGLRMIEDGLFTRFPMKQVYGMHNWPGHTVGTFAINRGAMMAAVDTFDIKLTGKGGHAAMAYDTLDPIIAATQLVQAMQTIVSRNIRAVDRAVVSVTRIHAGDAFNVIPEFAHVMGTVRSYKPEVRDLVERRVRTLAQGVATAFEMSTAIHYRRAYPPTVNTPAETDFATGIAEEIVGAAKVDKDVEPSMGGEDFAYMLEERPGCYIRIGNGSAANGRQLHAPQFDFNDEILPYGASYWARLVECALPTAA